MKNVVCIFGTSGMALETGQLAEEIGFRPIFVAESERHAKTLKSGFDVFLEEEIEKHLDLPYVIGIGDPKRRYQVATKYLDQLRFINLIHPSATLGKEVAGQADRFCGNIIAAGARLTSDVKVGDFIILNLNATVSHDSVLEDFVTVSPQACILGNVHVKKFAWIGAGAIINQGSESKKITIGCKVTVGSGAVVLSDCEEDKVYVGIPAREKV